jgi:hypothetical protein
MDGPVERTYLTGVEELREICKNMSSADHEYRIVRCDEEEVALSFNDSPTDDLNALCFAFPILPYIWPYGLPGLCRLNTEACRMIWKDGIEDWGTGRRNIAVNEFADRIFGLSLYTAARSRILVRTDSNWVTSVESKTPSTPRGLKSVNGDS